MRASEAALLTVLLTVVVFQPSKTAGPAFTTLAANGTRLEIQFTLNQTFTLDLNNHTSTAFRDLSSNITSLIDKVYSIQYSVSFLQSEVISFSNGSIQVDLDLVFNSTGSVPNITTVISVLLMAIDQGNISLPIDPMSIKGREVATTSAPPTTAAATTSPAVTMHSTGSVSNSTTATANTSTVATTLAPPTTAAATTTPAVTMHSTGSVSNSTSASANTSTAFSTPTTINTSTTSPSSTTTLPATPVPQNTIMLIFKIVKNFTEALNNRNSLEFINLATNVTSECDMVFRSRYARRFIRTFVVKFRSGSVITDLDVEFNSTKDIPMDNDIIQTFRSVNFSLQVDFNTINITRNENTTGSAAPLSPSSPFPALLFSLLAALLSARLFLH